MFRYAYYKYCNAKFQIQEDIPPVAYNRNVYNNNNI